jgi:hypothetical protein
VPVHPVHLSTFRSAPFCSGLARGTERAYDCLENRQWLGAVTAWDRRCQLSREFFLVTMATGVQPVEAAKHAGVDISKAWAARGDNPNWREYWDRAEAQGNTVRATRSLNGRS